MFPEPKTGNNGPELQKRRVRRIFIETAVGQRLLLLLSKKLVQNRVSWLWERKGKISRSQNVCACPFMDRYWQVGLASIKPWLLTLVCLKSYYPSMGVWLKPTTGSLAYSRSFLWSKLFPFVQGVKSAPDPSTTSAMQLSRRIQYRYLKILWYN